MKKENKKRFLLPASILISFVLWTLAISFIDVRAIGPNGSSVGFATVNRFVHELLGVHMTLYVITDWLSILPLCFILGFAVLGLVQWIKRRRILAVDLSILALGVFYIVVLALYLFFETVVINYRPVLIDGYLEASYPSSTTMLVLCVMPTAIMQLKSRIKNRVLARLVLALIIGFTAFMVIGRLVSGVHWFTDIIGGALLSSGLVMTYYSIVKL